jgi:hypothetical protein
VIGRMVVANTVMYQTDRLAGHFARTGALAAPGLEVNKWSASGAGGAQ